MNGEWRKVKSEKSKEKNEKLKVKNYLRLAFCLILGVYCSLTSCGIYSFTGVNTSVKSATVHLIVNQASIINPSLSGTLTEKLKDKIITGSPVSVIEKEGELDLSGTITNYSVSPVAASANETAALNRLSITIEIQCTNTKDDKLSWSETFTRFADFESSQDLSSVESKLVDEIADQLVDDIFNKALVNW